MHVETLQLPADIEQHPLQKAFIPAAKILTQTTEAVVIDDDPLSEDVVQQIEELHIERTESPIQMDEPLRFETQFPPPPVETKPRRPRTIHVDGITASPRSSEEESDGEHAWWQDYNRFMLKQQNPIIIPTS
jgi:hypothetical protein